LRIERSRFWFQGSGFRIQGLPSDPMWRTPLLHCHPDDRSVSSDQRQRSVHCLANFVKKIFVMMARKLYAMIAANRD